MKIVVKLSKNKRRYNLKTVKIAPIILALNSIFISILSRYGSGGKPKSRKKSV